MGKNFWRACCRKQFARSSRAGGEIIVVDNGSDDGQRGFSSQRVSAVWWSRAHGAAVVRARGQRRDSARRASRTSALLNNDMVVEPGFFARCVAAFDKVPDLFCATAQIFFPEGVRREETGKAVMPFARERKPAEFPVRCDVALCRRGSQLRAVRQRRMLAVRRGEARCSSARWTKSTSRPMSRIWISVSAAGGAAGRRSSSPARAWCIGIAPPRRATTPAEFLDRVLELNYLRFLARAVADRDVFRRLWQRSN